MSDGWPEPLDGEAVFAACLLAVGNPPEKGWSVNRSGTGAPIYVTPRSRAAHAYTREAIAFLYEVVMTQYKWRGYKANRYSSIAMSWKNAYFRWLWRKKDETD